MQAIFLVYPSIKFFIKAIKKNIVSTTQFFANGLHKLQNWLGETIFFLIAMIKNFMLG
jgi:hypothetical protein